MNLPLKAKKLSTKGIDKKEVREGVEEEHEHTRNPRIAKQIALDHLKEDPKYYTHLEAMEKRHGTETEHMNEKKAFVLGFVKSAMANGLTQLEAETLFKLAIDNKHIEKQEEKTTAQKLKSLGKTVVGGAAVGVGAAFAAKGVKEYLREHKPDIQNWVDNHFN